MTTCIGGGHDSDPPQADNGLMLCRRCHQRLQRHLTAITELWPLLSVMAQPSGSTGSNASGKPGSRPPCRLDVLDITDPRGAVSGQLVSWARVVIEDRDLSTRSLDAEQATRLLAVHADWLAAQPFADEALTEIAGCAHAVRRACGELGKAPIGTCRAVDPRNPGQDCGGPLYWIEGTMQVRCSRCLDMWTEQDLTHIASVVDVWIPIADAAHLLGVTVRTINRYAESGLISRNRGRVIYTQVANHVRSNA